MMCFLLALSLIALPSAATAAATPAQKQAAVAAVKAQLKDPASAQFRGIKATDSTHVCGWVNSKNGYGGYVGFQVFYYSEGKVAFVPPELSEPALC